MMLLTFLPIPILGHGEKQKQKTKTTTKNKNKNQTKKQNNNKTNHKTKKWKIFYRDVKHIIPQLQCISIYRMFCNNFPLKI